MSKGGKIDSISKIPDRWSLNKESDFTKDREGLIILQGKRKDSTRLNMWCVCKQIFTLTHLLRINFKSVTCVVVQPGT